MSKLKGPLFSLDAIGTLDKSLIYKKRLQTNTVSKYSKPGSKSAFESSPRQKDQRGIISLITTRWSCMTSLEQASWEVLAKKSRKPLTGYHLFLHTAKTNLFQYLGLIGYWSMNYSIEDSIPDLSGNSNHGILKPTYPSDCPVFCDSINPKFGKAVKLDGTGPYIDCGNNPILNNLTEFTYEFCLYNHTPSIQSVLLSEYPRYVYTVDGPRIQILFETTDNPANSRILSLCSPDTWYHIVFTYSDSGDRKIYIYQDGIEVDYYTQTPATGTLMPTVTWPFAIGAFPDGGYLSNGKFDEVRIWNRILGLTEIKKHYQMFRT